VIEHTSGATVFSSIIESPDDFSRIDAFSVNRFLVALNSSTSCPVSYQIKMDVRAI
jgi:hypothetical protein